MTTLKSEDKTSTPAGLYRFIILFTGAYAFSGGLITLTGWVFGLRRLTDWADSGISMFPNPAICAVLSATTLLLLHKKTGRAQTFARVFAVLVAAIGALTLFEHIFGMNVGIDTLVSNRPWGQRASTAPMRMGLPASVSFFILGAGLFLGTRNLRARQLASALATIAVMIASLSLVGYWYGADQLFDVPRLTGIALQTSTILVAIAIGLVTSIPESGVTEILSRPDAGGTVARGLLLPIIALPLILGWIRLMAQRAGLFDTAFGTSAMVLIAIAMLVLLLSRTARSISIQAQLTQAAAAAEIEARKAAEEANRAKDEFLAMLSHELRNPLSSILGWAVILRNGQLTPGRASQALEIIEKNARVEAQLVESLLDLSRIAAGKLKLHTERVDLLSIAHTIVDSMRPAAGNKGVSIELSTPQDPIIVVGDSGRLQQIFSNLLTNAVNFTPRGGHVEFCVTSVGSRAQVQVRDDGEGIDPEFLPLVFDRFRQADGVTSRAHGGLGLGLAIVRELVQAHGGTVDAESAGKGRGSTFTVTLPIPAIIPEHIEAANPQFPRAEKAFIAGIRVLVVDDDADAREFVTLTLQSAGASTQTAASAAEALASIQRDLPDLMIADIGMPKEDGYRLIQKLRAHERELSRNRLPAVALTAYASAVDRDQALAAGYDIHLTKPVGPAELMLAVAQFRKVI